jgi:hypothetical protein
VGSRLLRGPELAALKDFDRETYSELIEEAGGSRILVLHTSKHNPAVSIEPYENIAYVLDQLPAVQVYKDHGPPDAGPASGSGFVCVLRDGFSIDELAGQVRALGSALDADLQRGVATHNLEADLRETVSRIETASTISNDH